MVQKKHSAGVRSPGRPRSYDPATALRRATDAFWGTGFAGTSLDQISAATGMNRPSLQAAFGGKRELYLKALTHYWDLKFATMREALESDLPLDQALMRAYEAALSIYFSEDERARGCFVVSTALTEAMEDPVIRDSVRDGFERLDGRFEERFNRAQQVGELGASAGPRALAALASAVMHSIAVRARAGTNHSDLAELARHGIDLICGRNSGFSA